VIAGAEGVDIVTGGGAGDVVAHGFGEVLRFGDFEGAFVALGYGDFEISCKGDGEFICGAGRGVAVGG